MKIHILIIINALLLNVSFAQNNDIIVTCPENTFLGAFSCLDIENLPKQVSTIEEAMAPPYNIQIEGVIPENLVAETTDDNVIFFCNGDPRVVNREIIIYLNELEPPWDGIAPIARCNFTIETIPDLTPIEFIAPPDKEVDCNFQEQYPDEVTFVGDDCFDFDQNSAFFRDETRIEGQTKQVIRTWQTTDACGNLSEPQQQTITLLNCPFNNDYTIICPENTNLGTFDCFNIQDEPELPGNLEEAMAAPYNIQIEGDLSLDLRVHVDDNGTVFYCENDPRSINRNVVIYIDHNINFVWDLGEEIGGCNYIIETIPDVTPIGFSAPPDIEIACGVEPGSFNTGDVISFENDCPNFIYSDSPFFYVDQVSVVGDKTTILRTWQSSDACGNLSETQVQTITVNCAPVCNLRPATITCE